MLERRVKGRLYRRSEIKPIDEACTFFTDEIKDDPNVIFIYEPKVVSIDEPKLFSIDEPKVVSIDEQKLVFIDKPNEGRLYRQAEWR